MDRIKQYKRQNDFIRRKYDRINILLPAGLKNRIQAQAAAVGLSVNRYIILLIDGAIKDGCK